MELSVSGAYLYHVMMSKVTHTWKSVVLQMLGVLADPVAI